MARPTIDKELIPFFEDAVLTPYKIWTRTNIGRTFEEFFWSTGWESNELKKLNMIARANASQKAKLTAESEARATAQVDEELNKRRLANQKTYTSFSGADIVASIRPSGGKPIIFGEIQTISYSIHRQMQPVYSLGRINPKGIVRGPRIIAGTMIFTVFDRHVLKQVMDTYKTQDQSFKTSYGLDSAAIDDLRKYAKTDEMPPFDINISFMNEYGQSATLNIYGIYIMSEGQTMSIEDMITENTMSYIAMDIDLMDYGVDVSESNPLK